MSLKAQLYHFSLIFKTYRVMYVQMYQDIITVHMSCYFVYIQTMQSKDEYKHLWYEHDIPSVFCPHLRRHPKTELKQK